MHSRFPYEGDQVLLDDENFPPTPLHQVLRWLEEAIDREQKVGDIVEPTALQLATVGPDAMPSIRTVFIRFLDGRGPGFVSFAESRKSLEIKANQRVSARMGWLVMGREIQFRGVAEQIADEELDAYWRIRPRGAQITALASRQTGTAPSRAALEQTWSEVASTYGDDAEIPRPDYFIGYRIAVQDIEFLSMRDNRLNDRFYLVNPGGLRLDEPGWKRTRLQP